MKPKPKNLNELAAQIHRNNSVWWHDKYGQAIKRPPCQLLMLVITEIAEACEGIRKDLMDDHLPHLKMEVVEMADAYIRLMDFAAAFKVELDLNMLNSQIGAEACDSMHDDKPSALWQVCCMITREDGGINAGLWAIQVYCAKFKLDLWGAMEEKIEYNLKRADHKHSDREKAGGKKF